MVCKIKHNLRYTTIVIYKKITSPIGNIILSSDGENITGLHIKGARYFTNIPPAWILDNHNLLLQNAELQLAEYFDGERKTFDLPLLFNGTPFQMKIWNQLVHIPYGKTISYKELAKKISVPNALRAVGSAV